MGRHLTDFGKRFREKFDYTGKLTKECMGKELWNEYFKMKSKECNASVKHKNDLEERKVKRRIKHAATLKQRKETGNSVCMHHKVVEELIRVDPTIFDGVNINIGEPQEEENATK